VTARLNDRGIHKLAVSTFRGGFLNSRQPVVMGKAPSTVSSPSVHSHVSRLVPEDTDPSKTVDMASSPSVVGTSNTMQAEVVCTPRKVKGEWEIQNLECSINYDTKGAPNRRGKGKFQAV
jgi:hypothetical protein